MERRDNERDTTREIKIEKERERMSNLSREKRQKYLCSLFPLSRCPSSAKNAAAAAATAADANRMVFLPNERSSSNSSSGENRFSRR